MTRIDIGIASYNNADRIGRTIELLIANSHSDWRLLVVENASPDPEVKKVLARYESHDRIAVRWRDTNIGYAGAVSEIIEWAETPYLAYCDNDAYVSSPGWDLTMAGYLDRNDELGMVFPHGSASYPIRREQYVEILWGVGYFWMLRKRAADEIGGFDTEIGHQEEVDYQLRLRLAGWKCATIQQVNVAHAASSSNNPESRARIDRGIVNWMNKWTRYFGGANMSYHSPNVIRFEDWPPVALYLEEYWKEKLPGLNDDPETIWVDGRELDLIKVPRWKGLYRGRII